MKRLMRPFTSMLFALSILLPLGTADAAENVAGLALDTFLIGRDRAIALLGAFALFNQQNPVIRMFT